MLLDGKPTLPFSQSVYDLAFEITPSGKFKYKQNHRSRLFPATPSIPVPVVIVTIN